MTTINGNCDRPASAPTHHGALRAARSSLATLIAIIASVFSPACGDDEAAQTTNDLRHPDAATDASAIDGGTGSAVIGALDAQVGNPAPDAAIDASTWGEGTGPVTLPTTSSDAGAPSTADIGNGATTTDETKVAPRCAPIACTCPDPASPDCCPEAIAYRKAVVEASQNIDAGVTTEGEEVVPETPVYPVTRDEVWRKFDRNCGGAACHGGASNPTDPIFFKFTEDSFSERPGFGGECLERIKAPADRVMPPGTGDGTKRACQDQFVRLCEEIKALEAALWPQSGEVQVTGCVEEGNGGQGPKVGCGVSAHPYAVKPDLAQAQTNIGTCIPSPEVPTCDEVDLLSKDKQFAAYETSEDLPKMLWDTDLVSLDSEVLAAHRVFSYAPTYTLFSDNAKKQRYVRVPVGKVITYNDEIQDFDIPDNTRFYKTFLRQVVDKDGNVGYRKMETRLIVVRRDEEVAPGKFRARALRATYAWSEDEQKATLLDRFSDPLRNGEPWTDRLCPVVVDERTARDPAKNPISDQRSEPCEYMSDEEIADASSGVVRHYAIPGSTRCDECHMGANNHSYVLGFNPWQVDRRPADEGGVYDPVHPDELTQLRRFIEYGLISGITPGQAKLEESQGDRAPRNDAEVAAQAYMLGNCAYCHSPHGFPTVENPVLASLDFFPKRGESGGIYQFPVEKQSPRVRLGKGGAGRIAYINPTVTNNAGWPHRLLQMNFDAPLLVSGALEGPDYFRIAAGTDGIWTEAGLGVYGPVNSLIWRNVYTPFTYADTYVSGSLDGSGSPAPADNAIFIHMPRNVAGFDCRAHKIMANWILSIPADYDENGVVTEFQRADPNFSRVNLMAKKRAVDYALSVTGQHCPTDEDILDPSVLNSLMKPGTSIPVKSAPGPDQLDNAGAEARMNGPRLMDGPDGPNSQRIKDGIPGHAHWVTVDLNEPRGQWYPRRVDWKAYLAGSEEQRAELIESQGGLSDLQREKMSKVLPHLDSVFVNDAQREHATTPVPLGLWSSECSELAAELHAPAVADIAPDQSTTFNRWVLDGPFDEGTAQLPANRHVHSMSPGQAVFESICMNCHGSRFDSNSPLAKTVAEVTGGRSRVANFRDGLFGPVENPGAYAKAVFTFSDGNNGASAADWEARYLLWMGLGGTLAEIPTSVVSLISTTPFYGKAVSLAGSTTDANMLEPAAATCRALAALPIQVRQRKNALDELVDGLVVRRNGGGFAFDTGHYQLWESLCNYGQQPLIRVTWLREQSATKYLVSGTQVTSTVFFSRDRTGRDTYGTHWVGDQQGKTARGIAPSNVLPWCVVRPSGVRPPAAGTEEFEESEYVAWFEGLGVPAAQIPWCPETLFAQAFGEFLNEFPVESSDVDSLDDTDAQDRWYRQGAINAGLAALYYMEGVAQGAVTPALSYNSDQCAQRNGSP